MAKLTPIGHLTARQAAWRSIRELGARGDFVAADVALASKAGPYAVQDYLKLLVKAQILERTPGERNPLQRPSIYRLLRDLGVDAPKVLADGSIDDRPTAQERLWAAMKSLGEFRYRDLMLTAGVPLNSATGYVQRLAKAGYLAPGSRRGTYRLRREMNTGPRPPAIRRDKTVFDLNLGRKVGS